MSALADPIGVGGYEAPSRVVFGPHETNLGQGRAISRRHVAYYERRARGGAGVIVTETASVATDDWPYERAPLAAEAVGGWRLVAAACRPHSTLVLAGLGHAGAQGSSAFSQHVMWAPSRVADVVSREPPAELDQVGITALREAFGRAAAAAVEAGLHGVELDAGAYSLLRQFHSGLSNLRSDRYGEDRLAFTREVIAAVRRSIGDRILALRLSCDELAPWAGVTPEQATAMVAELAPLVDLLTVVRGGPFSTSAYRPDAHVPEAFNLELCRQMRTAAAGQVPVVLQGSVVDPSTAAAALGDGSCDLVEMTRALIADAGLVARVRAGRSAEVRPCIRCNQACRVRDNRNPIVSCVLDPASGHETDEPFEPSPSQGPPVLIVGAGPAGLECARVLASAGRTVRILERTGRPGGALARAAVGPGRESLRSATDWLAAEVGRLGVEVRYDTVADISTVKSARAEGWETVLATGAAPLTGRYPDAAMPVLDPLSVLDGTSPLPDGDVAVLDPVGDQVGVALAEWLAAGGRAVTLVAPDPVAGTQLARTGDLADANGRLQRAGVTRQLRSTVKRIGDGTVWVEDAWTGEPTVITADAVVDCGHRRPDEQLYLDLGDPSIPRAGDCVAPRSLLEAVLEGRRAALRLLGIMAPAVTA